ncbi:MAG: NAD-dependent epimerase/dehydratase family protein [Anaerolineae bacterium]|nr:NAD-dependent epimerase/dehydratase family protein [Anaerolineae bacterium]MCB9131415.1 NAD-dependent epimerase/dehydratase family protein [Anaerolineales bacterium]MCB0230626.1 NAD-dependent epimerase/dehydratase family protein [Anaerolineae bacterium]MCB0243853.1 NAD-dependent epimerase/dehydratase family protein [Anaerolineae bacterium]MCB0250118.1 NAD-dependent epimerase/dehydratase family protein [Anaerolineae bacterium]
MRFLITGGAGFIGTTLANHLVRTGHHVRVLDDLSAGDPSRLDARVLFSRGDVRNVPNLWTLLQDVECVYHLAARISVPESVLYPLEYNDVNVGGTVALLTAVRDVGVPRVVLTSSASVYGNQPGQPVHETMQPSPKSPYAITKIAAEHYLFMLGRLYNCDAVALRVFNAYGPGQRIPPAHAPVVPLFLRRALTGGSLVVHGNGSQTRDFVHIDDVVRALTAAASVPEVDGQVINIGSGQETSIQDLARVVGSVAGRAPSIIYNESQSPGVARLVADISLARRLLGYAPEVGLEQGLNDLLKIDGQFERRKLVAA